MKKFLIDGKGRIGFDTNPTHGPFKESIFWFSEDLNKIYATDGVEFVEHNGWRITAGSLKGELSTLDGVFDFRVNQLVLAQNSEKLELDYFCDDFTKLDLPSLTDRNAYSARIKA